MRIHKYLWLSAANPGATTGHRLIIFPFTRFYFVIPFGIDDGSRIANWLQRIGVYPEY